MKAKDTKRKTRTGAVRRIGALFLALTMTFGTWTPAFAEEPVPVIEEHVETPAKMESETPAKTEAAKPAEEAVDAPAKSEEQKAPAPAETEADGLEISPEEVPEGVGQSPARSNVDPVNIGDTKVSGKIKTGYNRRNKEQQDVTVTVTVTRQAGGGPRSRNVYHSVYHEITKLDRRFRQPVSGRRSGFRNTNI